MADPIPLAPWNGDVSRLIRDASERAGVALLSWLGDYHGQSRFEVWSAKFAIS